MVNRVAVLVLAILPISLTLQEFDLVQFIVLLQASLTASFFFAAVVIGLNWRRGTAAGAITSMVGGFTAAIGWYLADNPFGLDPVIPGVLVSSVLFVAVSLATKPVPGAALEPFFRETLKKVRVKQYATTCGRRNYRMRSATDAREKQLLEEVGTELPNALLERFATLVRESGSEDERAAASFVSERLQELGVPHRVHQSNPVSEPAEGIVPQGDEPDGGRGTRQDACLLGLNERRVGRRGDGPHPDRLRLRHRGHLRWGCRNRRRRPRGQSGPH